MKTIVVYNPQKKPGEVWLPVLWAQAKTYYEKYGQRQWRWWPCYADSQGEDIEAIKEILVQAQPDVFAVSLYVWNYDLVNKVCAWVKDQWPKCIIITGGPHQYFKHDDDWFRKHPYYDASLPGDCFGERCLQHLLDSDIVNWDLVPDVVYAKGKTRTVTYSKRSTTVLERHDFDYNWSAFAAQKSELLHLLAYHRQKHQRMFAFSIIETTRGCPYGCTYCDWGGGINTKVIKKDINFVKLDIDALCSFDLDFVYFADANLGIFGARDVEIVQYLVKMRKQKLQFFNVGYGGFAKTDNRLTHVQQILELDINHKLSAQGEIKISMQSLDVDVLKNIDRKNVSLDKQIATYKKLTRFKRLPLYVELIYGLPGMTIDKFYHELNVIGSYNLSIQWYPWQLLPETPAYTREYRKHYQLQTVSKTVDWLTGNNENPSEIVIGSSTYTSEDYLEMLLASGLYRLLIQGGYMKSTITWLQRSLGIGDIIRAVIRDFFTNNSKEAHAIRSQWKQILTNPDQGVFFKIGDYSVYPGWYFAACVFLDNTFANSMARYLQQQWQVPQNIIANDVALTVTEQNINTKVWRGFYQYDYSLATPESLPTFTQIMSKYPGFKDSGRIARGKRKFLGLLPL